MGIAHRPVEGRGFIFESIGNDIFALDSIARLKIVNIGTGVKILLQT